MQKVTPCLWFDGQAEQAAAYYVSLLPDSRIDRVVRAQRTRPAVPPGWSSSSSSPWRATSSAD